MLHQAPARSKANKLKFGSAAELIWENYRTQFDELSKSKDKLIIAISGNPGSGKSTLAYYLCELFIKKHIKPKHIWSDDLYVENYQMLDPAKREDRRVANSFRNIGSKEYSWNEIAKIMKAFRNNTKCRMPCVDLLNQQIDWLETDFKNIDVLVIEGLYAIDMNNNTINVDFKMFIDGETRIHQSNSEQKQPTLARKKILNLEQKAISKIKEENIESKDIIVLTYNKQDKSWGVEDFRQ